MRELEPEGEAIRIEGAASLEQIDGGVSPCRLPVDRENLFHPDLMGRARCASGVRLVTISDTTSIAVELECRLDDPDTMHADLVVDNELIATKPVKPNTKQTIRFDGLADGEKRVEVWLPQFGRTIVHGAAVDDDAAAHRFDDRRARWITYGSSITQCRQAHSPALIWPAVAARRADVHPRALGFGGQCHFDPTVARFIRECDADRISLKLGINTYGGSSYSIRTWSAAVVGFILTVRDGHPDAPMLIVSPIHAIARDTEPNPQGQSLDWMRSELQEIVEKLRGHGDRNLHYLHGHRLLGPDDAETCLNADGVHPNGNGYTRMGERFADLAFGPQGPLRV